MLPIGFSQGSREWIKERPFEGCGEVAVMIELAQSAQFVVTIGFIVVLARLAPFGALSHRWMKG